MAGPLGGYTGLTPFRYFVEDPNDPTRMICRSCYEEYNEALMELNLDEEYKDESLE